MESNTARTISNLCTRAERVVAKWDYLTFRDGERWRPLISQNIQANATIGIDIWVIDAGCEVNLWWLERVICWESNAEEKDA